MASWEVLLVLFKLSLYTGGFPNLFVGFIVNVCGMLFVYASIAELASMYVNSRNADWRTSDPADAIAGPRQLEDNIIGYPNLLRQEYRSL